MRILVIEDDNSVSSYIAKGLAESGHRAEVADKGLEGLHRASTEEFDALIIDRMLPELEGLEIVQKLRSKKINTPVLVLSALGNLENRVEGLKVGGDDYLAKPFAFSELLARLEAIVRRVDAPATVTQLTVHDLTLNLLTREVKRAGQSIDVLPTEFRILEVLMRYSGQVVTRTMLLEKVWDYNFDPQTSIIDVHISRLRAKVDKEFDCSLIHTVRGSGYMMTMKPDKCREA